MRCGHNLQWTNLLFNRVCKCAAAAAATASSVQWTRCSAISHAQVAPDQLLNCICKSRTEFYVVPSPMDSVGVKRQPLIRSIWRLFVSAKQLSIESAHACHARISSAYDITLINHNSAVCGYINWHTLCACVVRLMALTSGCCSRALDNSRVMYAIWSFGSVRRPLRRTRFPTCRFLDG